MSSGSSRRWLAAAAAIAVASAGGFARAPDASRPTHIDASAASPPIAWASDGSGEHRLRVCADPNNLPFSNSREEGFENRIAQILARDLGLDGVAYTWWPQRRGFVRNTLAAGACDVVMGVPADYERTATTRAYYRSTYVLVSRHERHLALRSLDDPRLRRLRIGLHVIGDDYANVPPAQALARRGIVANVRGYSIYGDYSRPDPPRSLLDALVHDEIDVAIAWGPLAGYFARREPVTLDLAPVAPVGEALPMTFAIAVGVRRGDARLRSAIDQSLVRRRADIQHVLVQYGVPQAGMRTAVAAPGG
jgi:quinoprotein dehydrogenase-associated probable ABC transporter substrate-binding protein